MRVRLTRGCMYVNFNRGFNREFSSVCSDFLIKVLARDYYLSI